MKFRALAVGGLTAVMALTAACSSSTDSTTTSSAAAEAASPAASAAGSAAPEAGAATGAAEFLAPYQEPPTALGIDVPLSKAPEAGKRIALLQTPEPISKVKYDATVKAAELLGWEAIVIPMDGTPEGTQAAFQQALDQKVDGIAIGGAPRALYEDQLAAAAAAGIPVIQDSTADTPTDGITAVIDGPNQVAEWGKMNAAWIAEDSQGTGNVLVFNIQEYPILGVWRDGLSAGMAEFCPECTVTNVEVGVADFIAGKVPNLVASEFRRNPDAKYAMFAIGGLTTGVQAALDAAGITDVKIGGESPDAPNIQALKDGTEVLWTGFPTVILGWRIADAFARAFNGDDVAIASEALLPTQILTTENIGTAPIDETGTYIGYPDYETAFKQLWLLQ